MKRNARRVGVVLLTNADLFEKKDLRVGQVIANALSMYGHPIRAVKYGDAAPADPFYIEDDQLADIIEMYIDKELKR